MEEFGSHRTDCDDFFFFRKAVQKIQVLFKSDNNNGRFTRRSFHILMVSLWILGMGNVSDKFCRINRTHFMFKNFFFHRRTRCLSDNVEKCGTAGQNRLKYNTAHALCVSLLARSEYVIIIALPRQWWLRERASILRYTYISCLFFNYESPVYTVAKALALYHMKLFTVKCVLFHFFPWPLTFVYHQAKHGWTYTSTPHPSWCFHSFREAELPRTFYNT
jgi:hypothetical protein